MLRDTAHLQAQLQDIEQLADEAGAEEARDQVQNVQGHLDRVAAWGLDRQRAWSKQYQFVQRYLRTVVRLDPDRAISHRLRTQLGEWLEQPFFIVYAREPSIRLFREQESRVLHPPVTRPSADRDYIPALIKATTPARSLETRVAQALASGCTSLSEVLEVLLPELPAAERYRRIGQITAILAEQGRVQSSRERRWRPLKAAPLEIEEWRFDQEGDP